MPVEASDVISASSRSPGSSRAKESLRMPIEPSRWALRKGTPSTPVRT